MSGLNGEKRTQGNQSVDKAFQIIELLADTAEPMRLMDIAKRLEINSSTVIRFLTTLQKSGYIAQNAENSRYYLTYKFCEIANKINAGNSIRDLAAPYMRKLSKIFSESICLAVEEDMKVIYIYVVEGSDMMLRSMQRIGNNAPMHCTGIGKLFLTGYTERQIDLLIESRGLKRFTPNTITSKLKLMAEIENIRLAGFAFDDEECEIGARCVASPVRDHTGKIVAGISVTGPANRLTDGFIREKLSHLTDLTAEISDQLGCRVVGRQ